MNAQLLESTCSANAIGANFLPGDGVSFRVRTGPGVNKLVLRWYQGPDGGDFSEIPMELEPESASGSKRWRNVLRRAKPGDRYGYRVVEGWWNPRDGHLHDPEIVLVDPAGRLLGWGPPLEAATKSWRLGATEALKNAPLTVIGDPYAFDWGNDEPLNRVIAPEDQLFYEANVRGATIKLDRKTLGGARPGTYSAIASDYFINHLLSLGVNVLELYVCQQSLPGFGGYWNYNPLLWGAPELGFATDPGDPLAAAREFDYMVLRLHQAGILLCLDGVWNHTLEGNEQGQIVGLKGLDNHAYWLCGSKEDTGARCYYLNWSGCGNTVNYYNPDARALFNYTLLLWLIEHHVDLCRFDLAGAMFSNENGIDDKHPLLAEMTQSPFVSRVLATVRMTGEPWSFNSARFNPGRGWGLWDDFYRDTVRKFWLGRDGQLGDFVEAITGSRRRFPPEQYGWWYMVSGITFHDGFGLAQMGMYDRKSNEDGHPDDLSSGWGCNGTPADDATNAHVVPRRWRYWKAMMATLLVSPSALLRHGDELLYWQGDADNNPYDSDDKVNGIDWSASPEFLAYVRNLSRLRSNYTNLGRMIFTPAGLKPGESHPYGCYDPLGGKMCNIAWHDQVGQSVTLYLPGNPEGVAAKRSTCNLLLIFNSSERLLPIRMPFDTRETGRGWVQRLHTGKADPFAAERVTADWFQLEPKSVALLVSEPL